MSQTFATSAATNDLFLGANGNLVLLSGIEAVKAACETSSKLQLGEAVLQMALGIPNFQLIWVGVPDYALWESYLQTALQNVDGVQQVNDVTIKASNNILSYTAEIQTIYGTDSISGILSK